MSDVLVAFDGSSRDEQALLYAASIARHHGMRLTVALVLERNWCSDLASFTAGAQALILASEDSAIEQLRSLIQGVPDDMPVTSMVRRGGTAQTLADVAAERRSPLVVVGCPPDCRRFKRIARRLERRCGATVRLISPIGERSDARSASFEWQSSASQAGRTSRQVAT